MTDVAIQDRLNSLESEIKSLKVKVTEDCHWRKILEEWLLNRFGFDVNIELNKKPSENVGTATTEVKLSTTKYPESEDVSGIIPDDEEMLLVEGSNNAEINSSSPSNVNDSEIGGSKEVVGSNDSNIPNVPIIIKTDTSTTATVVPKIIQEKAQDQEISKSPFKTTINVCCTNTATTKIVKNPISEVSLIPENTEYHVTLKAKNAIKKLEDGDNGESRYECKECQKLFDNLYKAEGHARHHFETKFKCIDCPLYFEVEQDLILHAQVLHYKIRKRLNSFTCYIGGCPWTSKSPDALRHHRTLKHSDSQTTGNTPDNPAQPDPAPDSSKSPETEDVIMKDVSGEPTAAAVDASEVAKTEEVTAEPTLRKAEADDLISYKGRSNGENSQWQCKVCEKSFSELTLAKTHVTKLHSTLHFPAAIEKKGRHVVCRVCKKAFSNDNWLKRHELAEHRNTIKKYAVL